MINTTNGPAAAPRGTRESTGHTINTTRILEEDLTYVDAEPEILTVLPGGDWCAIVEGVAVPLVVWTVLDDGSVYGVAVGADGRIDLTDSMEQHPGFVRYEQANNRQGETK